MHPPSSYLRATLACALGLIAYGALALDDDLSTSLASPNPKTRVDATGSLRHQRELTIRQLMTSVIPKERYEIYDGTALAIQALGNMRAAEASELLASLIAIEAPVPTWEPQKPVLNIAPPGGPYPAGVDPAAIPDPTLRAEYEKRIEANRSYALYYGKQSKIFRTIDQLAESLLRGASAVPVSEMRSALGKVGLNPTYIDDFSTRLRR